MAWMVEDYRLFRGEGVRRLPETFVNRAADLSRWFKRICLASKQVKDAAQAKAAQAAAAKAASPAPAPLADASAPAAVPLPLSGPPVSTTEEWGCGRCRGAKSGCQSCNPYKMAKWADKQSAKESAEQPAEQPAEKSAEQPDRWAGWELPASKRRKR